MNRGMENIIQARSLELIYLYFFLCFITCIQIISHSCWLYLQNVSTGCPFFSIFSPAALVYVSTILHLQSCDSPLSGIPSSSLRLPQIILYRVVKLTCKSNQIIRLSCLKPLASNRTLYGLILAYFTDLTTLPLVTMLSQRALSFLLNRARFSPQSLLFPLPRKSFAMASLTRLFFCKNCSQKITPSGRPIYTT